MSSVKSVDTYMFENGNSGYYRLSISVRFMDGSVFSDTLNTGLDSDVKNLMLCNLDELLDGELTDNGCSKFQFWKNRDWWNDAVIVHGEQSIKDMEEELANMRFSFAKHKLKTKG